MRIIIIGVGEVGFHVAKALSQENFDITVIDIDPFKCRRATEHLDVIVVEGNGASPKNLLKANVEGADYVLALTRSDEVNLISSQQAHVLGAIKIIARLRNQQYSERDSIIRPEKFGVDLLIHPEKVVCQEIVRLVCHPYAKHIMEFEGGRLLMIGLRINADCKIVGSSVKSLCESCTDFKFGVVSVKKNGNTVIPWSDFVFEENSTVNFIVKTNRLENLLELIGIPAVKTKRIMISGGSKIGRTLAEELQDKMSVRIIENRRDKAGIIANQLQNTMVIHADGTDVEFLKSENVHEIDSYIAVTENERTNLLSGFLAHHLGVKQAIMHMITTDYLPIIQEIGIGAVVSKNMSTVNTIIREIRSDQSEVSLITFDELDVEAIEIMPEPGSRVTQFPLSEIDFPKESIVGVINHHGHLSIARGDSQVTHEDTVLAFAKNKVVPKLRKLFIKP
jgi:trk system potassium uptake protein TrkA